MILTVAAERAWAQPGWYYTPSLGLSEVFDDNIFSRSSRRESDFISRLTSNLSVGYRSQPLTLLATSSFEAEAFVEHPERGNGVKRKQAGLEFEYLSERLVKLRLQASFAQTQTPSDLVRALGLDLGRSDSEQLTVAPSVSYRFDKRTSGEASYSYVQNSAAGVTNLTHQVGLQLSRQLTLLDAGSLAYSLTRGESGDQAIRSDGLTIGWTRRLSPRTTLSLGVGARLSQSGFGIDANASLTHRLENGNVSFAYSRSETTIVGRVGAVKAQALSGQIAVMPLRSLQLSLGSSIAQVSSPQADTMAYTLNASATYPLTKHLSVVVAYRFALNEGRLTASVPNAVNVPTGPGAIIHNTLSIGLQLSYPTRLD